MSRTTPALALLAAFVGASAQASVALDSEIEKRAEARSAVSQQLRDVEVELYCDHPNHAMQLMREARLRLLADPGEEASQGLREIDQVIWHVRHKDTEQAIAALESARERLRT